MRGKSTHLNAAAWCVSSAAGETWQELERNRLAPSAWWSKVKRRKLGRTEARPMMQPPANLISRKQWEERCKHAMLQLPSIESVLFKGIVYLKFNICWKCAHLPAIQDADESVSESDLEKCSIASLALQWMGAVRMRVQTADKNITIIHTTPVHLITCVKVKNCVFERAKFIIKIFNNTSGQNMYPWSIIMLPPVKKSMLFSQIKIHLNYCLELFWLVGAWSVHIYLLIQTRLRFSVLKAILWIMVWS